MFEALVVPSRAEDGCKAYHLHVDKKDPSTFYTYEEWTSEEKLNVHLEGAKPTLTQAQPLLERELKIDRPGTPHLVNQVGAAVLTTLPAALPQQQDLSNAYSLCPVPSSCHIR